MRLIKLFAALITLTALWVDANAQVAGPGVVAVPAVRKLAASAIPFIISPTGTMANNGADTLGTALPTTYANAFIYLPAGAIASGIPAAATWYFTQCSSTTVCTICNSTYTSGQPSIPGSCTAFSTTGPGAYTGVTTTVIGPQITIPAGVLGPNGVVRLSQLWSVSGTTNSKILSSTIGGTTVYSNTLSSATQFGASALTTVWNRGSQTSNIGLSTTASGLGASTQANIFLSINFGAAQIFTLSGQLAVATDYLVMEAFQIEATSG